MEKSQIQPEYAGLLKRAKMFLEDGEFDKAHEYAERVLDIDPECAEAYAVNLCADLKVKSFAELSTVDVGFENNSNYKKIIRFGCGKFKSEIEGYAVKVNGKIQEKLRQQNIIERQQNIIEQNKLSELARARSRIACYQNMLAAYYHAVVRLPDGHVAVFGEDEFNYGYLRCSSWNNIVSVDCCINVTVGLRADGSVVASGDNSKGQCNVGGWRGILCVATNGKTTLGVKADGTVLIAGERIDGAQNISQWRDIVAVAIGENAYGLKKDGTVVTTCASWEKEVAKWRNIVQISDGVALQSDGRVVTAGYNSDIAEWRDIIAVSKGAVTVGLKKDGTLVFTSYIGMSGINSNSWVGKAAEWKNVVAVAAGNGPDIIALKNDGTVRFAGFYKSESRGINGFKVFYTAADARAKLSALNTEKNNLNAELNGLKGLFTAKRKKQIAERLSEIERQSADIRDKTIKSN